MFESLKISWRREATGFEKIIMIDAKSLKSWWGGKRKRFEDICKCFCGSWFGGSKIAK